MNDINNIFETYDNHLKNLEENCINICFLEMSSFISKLRISKNISLSTTEKFEVSKEQINTFNRLNDNIENILKEYKIKLKDIPVEYGEYDNAKKALKHIDVYALDENEKLFNEIKKQALRIFDERK